MPKTWINGIDLYYNIYGSGAPVILVHGLGWDQHTWDPQIPALSKDYQVIVYDVRGHGQSGAPDQAYSIELFADDLHHLLRFLGLPSAILVGLSLGGRILLQSALKYPEETRALILADAQSETPEVSRDRFQMLARMAREKGMEKTGEIFFTLPFLQHLAAFNPAVYQREKAAFRNHSAAGFARTCLAIAGMEPLTPRLGEIQAPTLALAGEKDEPYIPFLDIYAQRIPKCRKLIIPRAGHVSNLENPEAFNEAVLSFLNGLKGS